MRFIVYGAGAVGSVLGGHLALKKHDVLLVCRKDHAEAIRDQKGLRMKSGTGDYFAELDATAELIPSRIDDDTIIFFTPKSYDTRSCVESLAEVAPSVTPVVSFQNGVTNEEIVAEKFENVFGGICRMTCSFLQPGQVSFRKTGRLVVGRFPKGAHPQAKKLGKVLEDVGFEVSVSNRIQCDKWLKLVTNLQSAFNAVIDPRDHDSIEFVELKIGVLREAKKALKSSKIMVKSCDGKDSSIDEMIAELQKPRASRPASTVRVNNSTWQALYKKRGVVENEAFHGPVIELGRQNGIDMPFNSVALELVRESGDRKLDPGAFRAADVLETIKGRTKGR
jgi:2-dehydropantoate 2-reductase